MRRHKPSGTEKRGVELGTEGEGLLCRHQIWDGEVRGSLLCHRPSRAQEEGRGPPAPTVDESETERERERATGRRYSSPEGPRAATHHRSEARAPPEGPRPDARRRREEACAPLLAATGNRPSRRSGEEERAPERREEIRLWRLREEVRESRLGA